MAKRIIDSHAHIGDIFHENKNITFKTNIKKGDYDDPFIDCERSGYTIPLIPKKVEDLINAGQFRSWEWTLENLIKELNDHPEVQGIVMLPIWPNQTYEEYWAASKLEPRIIPFTTCVLDMPVDEMADKLRRDIKNGAKGLKLHPTIQNVPLDDPKIESAVKVFRDADLPVLTHCGANPYYTEDSPWSRKTNPAYSDIKEVAKFCHKFADTKIIVAHCCSAVDLLYEHVKGLPNVYTDTSMCSAALMRKGVELLGKDKILFGTDVPFGSFHYSIAELDKAFLDQPEILDKVAFGNIAALMHLEF
ncbi:MAG: amidohydrolase family protein [Spirochaetaceae bacterium]|jgi:predicted TIM-barrel fold metal-dependent hydrolase|nr:amidohydrolase family protein [Spirochaetaceae bacterium]